MGNKTIGRMAGLATALLAGAGHADGSILHFAVELTPECVGSGSTASGSGTFTLDTDTNRFIYRITLEGLEGNEFAAHIHGPVADTCDNPASAPVVMGLLLGDSKLGAAFLTEQERADLIAGTWHVNIHTDAYQDGEIAGQIVGVPVPTASTWGLICLGLTLASAGSIRVRRRPNR